MSKSILDTNKMSAMDDDDEEWNDEGDQPQGYQALLDPDEEAEEEEEE